MNHSHTQARFSFKRNRLRCLRCVNENRKKRKRLRWQAANHGCHCFDRAFVLAGACVCCVKIAKASACISFGFRLRNASDCVCMETGLHSILQTTSTKRRSFERFRLTQLEKVVSHFIPLRLVTLFKV